MTDNRERAIAAKHWAWCPGMHTPDALVVSVIDGCISEVVFDGELRQADWIEEGDERAEWSDWYNIIGALPDLDNAATLALFEREVLPRAWAGVDDVVDVEVTFAVDPASGLEHFRLGHRCRVFVHTPDASWCEHWVGKVHRERIDALLECLEAAP